MISLRGSISVIVFPASPIARPRSSRNYGCWVYRSPSAACQRDGPDHEHYRDCEQDSRLGGLEAPEPARRLVTDPVGIVVPLEPLGRIAQRSCRLAGIELVYQAVYRGAAEALPVRAGVPAVDEPAARRPGDAAWHREGVERAETGS